ncbi:MAG: hypothetical protein KKD18_02865 [Nanoarchaeota archaeon]|nr:hypothetical protein [Nanoarchaeota archaeon]MBU0977331.1 hypothetical protein [Nanoarchaeota archaeon]
MGKKSAQEKEEAPKKIDDWDFETKYQMLSPELKLLHQIVLLRSDIDTVVYILLSLIPLVLAIKYNIAIALFSVTILLYGFYRHLRKRADLKHRFEHASTFGFK